MDTSFPIIMKCSTRKEISCSTENKKSSNVQF